MKMPKKVSVYFKEYKHKHIVLLQIMHRYMSVSRIAHCERVSQLCLQFAQNNRLKQNCNVEHAFLAGITHDICREYSTQKLYDMVNVSSMYLSLNEKKNPILLHAKAAILFLKQYYPLPQEVYDAIKTHILGDGMTSVLQKIVYISDALDGRRKIWDSIKNKKIRQRILALNDIDKMTQKLTGFLQSYYK